MRQYYLRPLSSSEMPDLKRVQVHLSENLYDYLCSRAKQEGRKPGNLAAWLLTQTLEREIAQSSAQMPENAPRA